MAPEFDDEEAYISSEDSDFAPDEGHGGAHDASEASDEDEADEAGTRAGSDSNTAKRKRVSQAGDPEDEGFENSGDEAIIEKGRKRRRKGKHQAGHEGRSTGARQTEEEEDDDDEGIRIKTRSQRAVEKAERRVKAASGPVTVDVDALWAEMMNGGSKVADPSMNMQKKDAALAGIEGLDPENAGQNPVPGQDAVERGTDQASTIRIKRTYNFAGKVHTEEKVVQRDSAEARLYLASLGQDGEIPNDETNPDQDAESTPRRLLRKAFRSVFEPPIETLLPRGDLNLAVSVQLQARAARDTVNAKKLNVVEKSRMDWAGFVDKEGIKDDLMLAGKSKESFAARQEFLARSEARREDDAYRARMAAKA
jgi:hypothetical protein